MVGDVRNGPATAHPGGGFLGFTFHFVADGHGTHERLGAAAEQLGISVGEGVVGDVQYNWANEQLELGIGIGVEGPGLGPLGSSAKGLGVLRIGGDHIVAVGFRENIQAAVASPVAGVDIDLSDEYVWGASAGRPDLAAWH